MGGGAFSLVVSVAAAFVLSACSESSEDRLTRLAKKALKEKSPSAELLSFEQAQTEFGVKSKECLTKQKRDFGIEMTRLYAFVKVDGETKVVAIDIKNKKDESRVMSGFESVESFKKNFANCF